MALLRKQAVWAQDSRMSKVPTIAQKPKRKVGRQPEYNRPPIVTEICDRLEKGETMTSILNQNGMPAHRTVLDWAEQDNEIAACIARAREIGFDAIADSTFTIADDGSNDTYTDEDGETKINQDIVARSKLRIWTRLQLLAKWCPKRYADAPTQQTNVQVGVGVNVAIMSEPRRKELMDKKRAAIERRRALPLQLKSANPKE